MGSSCSSEVDPDTDSIGLNYFPLEVGMYRIYDVHEILYSITETTDSVYQLRELVADSLIRSDGSIRYFIHRSTKANENDLWELDSIWTSQLTSSYALTTESNITYQKLTFPISHNQEWNGNAFNTLDELAYSYDLTISDTTLVDNSYINLVKVIQSDNQVNFLSQDDRFEVYAPDIGLIIKRTLQVNFCVSECDEVGEIETGRDLTLTISSYGKD